MAQAEVLGEYMVPGTFVAYSLADLAGKLPEFQARGAVVAKRDRAHLGLGVSLSGPPWKPYIAWRASRGSLTPWWCSLSWTAPGT